MVGKCCFMFAVTLFWWSLVVTSTHAENILLLNLFNDEESSENIDSNLEKDLISTYNFNEDSESTVFKKETLNNTEPEIIDLTKLQPNDFADKKVLPTLNKDTSFEISQATEVSEEKTTVQTKYTTNDNAHTNIFGKATVQEDTSESERFPPVLPERSAEGGLYSFVQFCFDMIASFIQGVMKGIVYVSNSKLSEKVSTDYTLSTSRIRKRDVKKTENEAFHNTEPSADKPSETNVNKPLKENSDLKINIGTTVAQHKGDNLQHSTTDNTSKHSKQSLPNLEKIKSLGDNMTSSTELPKDGIVSDSTSILKKMNIEDNGNSESLVDSSKKGFRELNENVMEDIEKEGILPDTASKPTSPLQEKNIVTNTNKEDQDLDTPLDYSTVEKNSNDFLLDDFINKQTDADKVNEIIKKQFPTAMFYPQPNEGEYKPKEETFAGTILIATGAVFVVLVLASVGLAAAYKLGLIGRNNFGNRNSSSQRSTMA